MDLNMFEILFRTNYKKVYYAVFRIVADEQLALDAVQEAFCKGLEKIDLLRDKTKFAAWITSIACNFAFGELKKQNKLSLVGEITENLAFINSQHSDYELPENAYELKQTKQEIMTALMELGIEQREVIFLRYYFDLSYSEIAEMLNINDGTVKSRLHRAKVILERKLKAFNRLLKVKG